jgi:FG-GAP-like repeat
MRKCNLVTLNSRLAVILAAPPILALTLAASAVAQTSADPTTSTSPSATTQTPTPQDLKNWRAGMKHVPLPKTGCFKSAYPSTQWTEVPCTTAPLRPYPPANGTGSNVVGNGNDVSVQVSGHIFSSEGSFDSVSGVTSETGQVGGTGGQVADTFSLQLNANFFSSPTCGGAANPANCQGWQQFVFSNGDTNGGYAFMQYWLINYSASCPAGWTPYSNDCYRNSDSIIAVPHQTITNLANLSVTGEADGNGMDTFIMGVGDTLYSVQGADSIVYLAQGWQAAEFNIVGDCCGSQANFNSGSTLVVRTNAASGTIVAPTCYGGGFTGETNNLNFDTAPAAQREPLPAVVFTESSGGTVSPACSSASLLAGIVAVADFDGDGKSDVLWRQTSGKVVIWEINGEQVKAYANVSLPATTDWQVQGTGDFDGDGKADILWRNTNTGQVAVWLMNGFQVKVNKTIGTVTGDWTFAGTGDFTGDGKTDILWRQTSTGNVSIWKMNGLSAPTFLKAGTATADWQIVGIGDFNGDGMSDILWRNTNTNKLVIWLMERGGGLIRYVNVSLSATSDWQVAGTGDFDDSGKDGILWRQTGTGKVAIWRMNGGQVTSTKTLTTAAAAWQIAGVGDFDGNGKSDILWRNTGSGDVAVWLIDGLSILSTKTIGTATADWAIQPEQ